MRMSITSKGRSSGLCELCLYCYRIDGKFACLAYPEQIPDKYWFNKELHTELVGDEAGEYCFKELSRAEYNKYDETEIDWLSMERIKDMGLIKEADS